MTNLVIKRPIEQNSVVKCFVLSVKINEIVKKVLVVGDEYMPEMYLKQPGFCYSVCGLFTRNNQTIEKFMQTGNADFIYKNQLHTACFQRDIVYGKSKD